MKVSRFASALAAAAMLAAPVVAEAGTRASGSSVYSASRASTSVKAENDLKPAYWIIILLSGGAAAYGISRALDNKSSGAN
jgi:hypothetical protein